MNNIDEIIEKKLRDIEKKREDVILNSDTLKVMYDRLKKKKVTYVEADTFAIEIGEIVSSILQEILTDDLLADGVLPFEIADKVVGSVLHKNHEIVTEYATQVQSVINEKHSLRLKVQRPKVDQDKVGGIVKKLSSKQFEDTKWLLTEPIINFNQSAVVTVLKANADFQYNVGLVPKIIRKATADCCEWCQGLVGSYDYGYEPDDVYRRHNNCRCTVDYYPIKNHKHFGRKQNVHTKKWREIR